ncbi:MAG: hypothetical protein KF789_14600 [Bdellovibrionaceae bacterium]|nr:hypothetical protein [Pseudobdellovibrionaceae bacterium]
MKTVLFPVLLSLAVGTTAFAQRLAEKPSSKAAQLAYELRQEEQYLSSSQKAEISRLLDEARRVIYGASEPDSSYTCVSRDNDGRAPYVFATRSGIQVTRISGETFQSQSDCQSTLSQVRTIRGVNLLCTSRDNDGREPYTLAALQDSRIVRIAGTSSSKSECWNTLTSMRVQGSITTICVSRDNDGRNPYSAAELDLKNFSLRKSSESFSSKEQCLSFIRN